MAQPSMPLLPPVPSAVNTAVNARDHQDLPRRRNAAGPRWKSVMTAADGQPAQAAVIAVLQTGSRPLRTGDVRERINRNRQEPLVNERVYQALVTLYQRGLVTRLKSVDHRDVYWQLRKTRGSGRKPADHEPRFF
jgi:hypothetical protein